MLNFSQNGLATCTCVCDLINCYNSRAFDVEMLYIAQQLEMPIKEVPVNWQEIDGMSVRGQ